LKRRLLFYVQHLLGIGHLVRAGRVAAALAEAFEVTLVVGGDMPAGLDPKGVDILRLPPVRAGEGGFSSLVHPDGRPFGEADRARRSDLLLDAFARLRPDVLLTEAFPFGRRQMRFELIPLMEAAVAARPRPLIAGSVRDILQETRPERQAETIALVRQFFDLVLVHGDPELFPLAASFPAAEAVAETLCHTGMVGPEATGDVPPGEVFDVIVSAGGGAVGADLLRAAVAARPLTRLRDARWLVLTGPSLAMQDRPQAADGVVIRVFAPDLPARLARARVSVSQAGYNTVADLAAARCRAVLVPFARDGETEQTRRAALLDDRGWAVALPEAGLTPAALAVALERALDLPSPGPALVLGGAAASRAILEHRLATRG
jgi:predicted glycosyltransferase